MSESYEPRDPNTQLYLRAKWLQEWTPILTIIISCLALAVVGIQACIYNQQRVLMNEQRAIMDKQSQTMNGQLDSMNKTLAETQKSADAAVASADAAKISARSTADMADQNKELVSAAKTQANASLIQAKTSQVSAKAAADSAQVALIGQYPRFNVEVVSPNPFVFPENDVLVVEVKATNTGQTTALRANLSANVRHGPPPLPSDIQYTMPPSFSSLDMGPGMATVLPIVTRKWTPVEVEEFRTGKQKFVIWLRMTYDDEFGNRNNRRQWCAFYDPARKRLAFCTQDLIKYSH